MRIAGPALWLVLHLSVALLSMSCDSRQRQPVTPCSEVSATSADSDPLAELAAVYFEVGRSLREVRRIARVGSPASLADGAVLMPVYERVIELLLRAVEQEARLLEQEDGPGALARELERAWRGMGMLTCELDGPDGVEQREHAIGEVSRELTALPAVLRTVLTAAVASGASVAGATVSAESCFAARLDVYSRWLELAERIDDRATDVGLEREQADAAWAALELLGSLDTPAAAVTRTELDRISALAPLDEADLAELTAAVERLAARCPRSD